MTGLGHDLDARIEGVTALRDALLAGSVPSAHALVWPVSPIKERVAAWLAESGVARYCRGQPDLTDAVVLSIIEESTAARVRSHHRVEEILRELIEAEERRRGKVSPKNAPQSGPRTKRNWSYKQEQEARQQAERAEHLRREAEARATAQSGDDAAGALARAWGPRLRDWAAIEEVFGELGGLCGLGWDLSRGVLRHTGWQDAERLAELLKRLPHIRDVVRQLGRMQTAETPDDTPILERLFGPVRRAPTEPRDIDTPLVPHDTRGVERSGEIARMLPSEAVLFIRPSLRLLWHARRAERALATYRVRGVEQERFVADDAGSEARDAERRKKKQERGPIIVCLDTSGSMQGAPETVAKAVTLEAVRIAHAEQRDCFLYAFSGPGQIEPLDLSMRRGGIKELLAFLQCSFHGGTDVAEPMRKAIERVETAKWSRADVILISDGEFPIPSTTEAQVRNAREARHLRVHGLLIGAERSPAMRALCDPVHVFRDWRALGEGRL
ncbi:MAG: VWA domain-containing protein [Phycisphaerales bacterium]|nr:VWA domain-containing protein [Phycisphaerales bacterium]MCB9841553.1 VWA domain-containing protein [Phycisphaeraceae bacterium]